MKPLMIGIDWVTVLAAVCRLGEWQFAVGETLGLTECKLECRCVTPPELTCIQYRSCEKAQEAAAQKGESQEG